jgi:non-structural maintenance of chromosomes element 1
MHFLPLVETDDRPILPNDITHSDFQTLIQTLNAALSPFAYEIRSQHSQTATTRSPDEARYALVNATSDPQTALATLHSPDEIAFVRRVLDAMFDANNLPGKEVMAVKAMDAIRLGKVSQRQQQQQQQQLTATQAVSGSGGAPAASLTMEKAEKMIDMLVEEEWFDRSGSGYLTLSTRSLMELGQWLFDTYNDPAEEWRDRDAERVWQRIKTCEGCKQIVTIVSTMHLP